MTTLEPMTESELNLTIAKLVWGEDNLVSRPTPYDDLSWYVKSELTSEGYFTDMDRIEDYATDLRAALRDLIEEEGDVDFTLRWNGVWEAQNSEVMCICDEPERAVCYYFIEKRKQDANRPIAKG